jgi:hypothetical protein
MTEWQPIPGWEGLYEAGAQGEIRRVGRVEAMGTCPDKDGYLTVWLSRDGASKRIHVAPLVLSAFHGPRPPGLECCHGNGVQSDNRIENLRWDTHSANMRDQVAHGTHAQSSKTHCPNKHPYDSANTAINPDGSRDCRQCNRDRWGERALKRRSLHGREPKVHGTVRSYGIYGCRCASCKAAKAVAAKAQREKQVATQ